MKKRQSSGAQMENSILSELEKGLRNIYGPEKENNTP
jgi:hypothetical protein